ncbi:hypothetical protein [Rhizobium sp. X9]|uniref:hypothetical protein n=1 Tax=Rhizobium sp. X9 TaxID=2815360 RepID=UPI001C0B527D|nr:hypothetical protein [Rhizobium sp. X9]
MDNPEQDIWVFPSSLEEGQAVEWLFENSRPVEVRCGQKVSAASDPRLRLFNMPISASGRAFPPEFVFDPEDGSRLTRVNTRISATNFPMLSTSGFSVLPPNSRYDTDKKTRLMNVPTGVQCLFAAGDPVHHFCITAAGDLYFSAGDDQWIFAERLAKPTGNPVSFGVVSFHSGFATVLSSTALVCEFVDGFPEISKQTLRLAGGSFCAPPSLIENGVIAFPVQRDGQLSVAMYDTEARRWLDEIVAKGQSIDWGDGFPTASHGSSYTPDVFWIGSNGYLTLTSELGTRRAETYAFPATVKTVAGVPPLRDEQDTIYALARTAEHYCYVSLSPNSRTVILSGPHVAAGRGRYIGRDFYPSLWSDEVVTFQIEAGTGKILLPLAFTTNAKGATESALVLLVDGVHEIDALFSKSGESWFNSRLYWHSGSQLYPLQISLRLRSRFDIMLLLEENALIVGSSLTNDFYRLEQ